MFRVAVRYQFEQYISRVLFLLHSTFYILHSTFYILHSTFYILHSTFYILHSTFYILHSAFCILHFFNHRSLGEGDLRASPHLSQHLHHQTSLATCYRDFCFVRKNQVTPVELDELLDELHVDQVRLVNTNEAVFSEK